MKRTLISFGLLLAAGCLVVSPGVIYGNGQHSSRSQGVSGFHTITNATSVEVRVHEAPSYSVVTTIDSNLQDVLLVERYGDVLKIHVSPGTSIRPTGHPLVDIAMPSFEGALAIGSGDITIGGVTGAKDIDLENDGSGGVTFDGTANRLTALAAGSGDLHLSGSAAVLVATVHGSGSIHARYLEAGSADLTTTGSGGIETQVMGGDIWCHLTGSGDIDYWGSGVMRVLVDSGSGRVNYRGGAVE